MAERRNQGIGLGIERFAPLVLAGGVVLIIYFYAPFIVQKFNLSENPWKIDNLYSAVFNWSAIQTGFAFGVYGFVVGKNDGFVKEIRDSLAMGRFLRYVKRANIGGFALAIFSLPLTIICPKISQPYDTVYWIVLAWFGLFVWTFAAFLRVAYGFGHLSSVKDRPEFYGA